MYPGSNNFEGGLRQIRDLVYAKDTNEKIICEVVNIHSENARTIQFAKIYQYFNNIIIDLMRLGVIIGEEDKTVFLLCLLQSSYNYLETTITCEENIIHLDLITATLSVSFTNETKCMRKNSMQLSVCE